MTQQVVQKNLIIRNKLGLHARAATKLAQLTHQFDAKIRIKQGTQEVDASSVMCLLLLASGQGKEIQVTAEGSQAEEALQAVSDLIEARFDEDQ
ncbi:HPr-like nitrogen-regulatory protein NPr [Pseudidiomarina planktonica]|uniref:HPr-like nitrogen-regulatory protein NPr n=1 Tax=Pseudidiomarina planktonica TaxID=1323738 RepID=A0A1Y6EIP6_9GAMM|nr:HPr family phosphocarrier protein [Pseudidiomarina planktonica]RUO66101.1 HPr family phosphocarrier protein [Pseudidiomarina planktonica]SMQ60452.1 HPr-like nitrogen-regulatory protein NPr [Pseudidiomarina planktonica]